MPENIEPQVLDLLSLRILGTGIPPPHTHTQCTVCSFPVYQINNIREEMVVI